MSQTVLERWIRIGLAPMVLSIAASNVAPVPAQQPAQATLPVGAADPPEQFPPLPYRPAPIDYFGQESTDPAALLAKRLEAGELSLPPQSDHGYLRGVLDALGIPVESQVLVFSKTSANIRLIGPKTPRAIYFNDDAYVAWVPGADALEISAIDPIKGAMFYNIPQDGERPHLVRRESCLLCHVSQSTLRIPGHVVRSFTTDDAGNPRSGFSQITHDTPLARRWGGWYVTGTHGDQSHLGNLIGTVDAERQQAEPNFAGNLPDLGKSVDAARYLVPHSDIVAHLVLEHQAHGHNLLARFNYETRLKLTTGTEDALLRYLVYADAPAFTQEIKGTSGFSEWFQRQGPRDHRGRSLRQLDLRTRLPKYRLSYLVHSRTFDALPAEAKERIYRRLWDILQGKDRTVTFPSGDAEERHTIIEILRETKSDLPDFFAVQAKK